jgi:uncharacterized protein
MTLQHPPIKSWPLAGVDAAGRLGWAADDASVREVMLNILLTRPGERLMRPEFGAGLLDFVHQPNTETTRHLIARVVEKSLARWEPRVVVDRVVVDTSEHDPAEVHLRIFYHLRHTRTPGELGLSLDLGTAQ